MKRVLRTIPVLVLTWAAALPAVAQGPTDPRLVVERQLRYYNEHDLDNFLSLHADDAEYWDFNGKELMNGKLEIEREYRKLFDGYPKVKASVAYRAVVGNHVIDHEFFKPHGDDGPVSTFIVIYTVEDGLIQRVDLIEPTYDN